MLQKLLERLQTRAEPGDSLVLLGDYVDRGPDTRAVIDQVLALCDGGWNGPVSPLMGNHEELMLDAMDGGTSTGWMQVGGGDTLRSYFGRRVPDRWPQKMPVRHVEFLRSLKRMHEDENGYYVHAGFRPGVAPHLQHPHDLLWIRDEFIESDYEWDKLVVFGHTPQYTRSADPMQPPIWRPLKQKNKIGLDTGAGHGGPLTALELPQQATIAQYPA